MQESSLSTSAKQKGSDPAGPFPTSVSHPVGGSRNKAGQARP